MSPGILALIGIGLLLGFRHAFEPDHLAAVSTLATRQGSVWAACRLGLAWAVGHTASGGVVVGLIPPGDLNSLLVEGVIAGVGAVVVFLPQILLLFLFIGFLEDTGYMARAAFL